MHHNPDHPQHAFLVAAEREQLRRDPHLVKMLVLKILEALKLLSVYDLEPDKAYTFDPKSGKVTVRKKLGDFFSTSG